MPGMNLAKALRGRGQQTCRRKHTALAVEDADQCPNTQATLALLAARSVRQDLHLYALACPAEAPICPALSTPEWPPSAAGSLASPLDSLPSPSQKVSQPGGAERCPPLAR